MNENQVTVLSWSGSDSSYDLIVQVIAPRPESDVVFQLLGMDETPRLTAFKAQAGAFACELLAGHPFGFRCIIAQRVPETFVWQARMRAALDKAQRPELTYTARGAADTA